LELAPDPCSVFTKRTFLLVNICALSTSGRRASSWCYIWATPNEESGRSSMGCSLKPSTRIVSVRQRTTDPVICWIVLFESTGLRILGLPSTPQASLSHQVVEQDISWEVLLIFAVLLPNSLFLNTETLSEFYIGSLCAIILTQSW
jgi:hypothetical protein